MISSLPFEYPEFPGGKERIMDQEPKKPLFGEAFSEAWLQLNTYWPRSFTTMRFSESRSGANASRSVT